MKSLAELMSKTKTNTDFLHLDPMRTVVFSFSYIKKADFVYLQRRKWHGSLL